MHMQSIPMSHRKYIKGRRNNKTVVLKRGCKKWPVKMIDWAFGEGWDKFVRENGVQEFDIVVFKHQGNMVFDTTVFDTSWCKREFYDNQVTKPSRKCRRILLIIIVQLIELRSMKMINTNDQHPSFIKALSSSDSRNRLYIPKKFALANGLSNGEMILKYAEHDGSWKVKFANHLGVYYYIQPGLKEFCVANGLKKGDRLKFELTRNGEKPTATISRE
ncbi:B3 domain-containing protein REM10-like [Bidens hawaiensis]|uniref:B3 domain-containing protein REM10-like n=1 Tax=Bidens hawaiensis TaxID=980011 RepID=UPI004049853C